MSNNRTGVANDPASIVEIPIPPIIPLELFERVQARLSANNPRVTPPRIVNGPILLTGLAFCATCGAGMTRTGTTRGERKYTYYSCAGCQQKGKSICMGRHIPVAKLDDLVTENVRDRLLTTERLGHILEALVERRSRKDAAVAERRAALECELAGVREKLARLYRAIEEGVVDLDADLKQRIQKLKSERDIAEASLERLAINARNAFELTPERIDAFANLMRKKIAIGDTQARKSYLRSIVSRVEVDDGKVRIIGEKASLANVIAGRENGPGNVRGFVRKWRARKDSNL